MPEKPIMRGLAEINGHVPGIAPPYFLQIVRTGNLFTSAISPNGVTWTEIGRATIPMPSNVDIGLAESSTLPNAPAIALLDSVALSGSVRPSSLPEALAAAANHFHTVSFRVDPPRLCAPSDAQYKVVKIVKRTLIGLVL